MQYTQIEWNSKEIIVGENVIDPIKPLQLLIGFHGAESTPENILVHGNRLSLQNSAMAFPEGPIKTGQERFSWWKDGRKQKETVEEFLNYCDDLIDQTHNYFKTANPKQQVQTSLWGFSQGASAALVYALLGNRPIFKVASVCGFLPEIPKPQAEKKNCAAILGIFGANDEVIPSFLAEHALEEMKKYGHQSTILKTPQGHEIRSENIKEIENFFNC